MTWGVVSIAGAEFREETDAQEIGDGGLRIFGQEAHPPRTRARVEAAHDNIRSLPGRIVPVTLTDKSELSGFYLATGARSNLHKWANGKVQTATWEVDLVRLGSSRDVEIESRMVQLARTDTLTGVQTPVFWHAPAVGTKTYYTGSTVPTSTITRQSEDGPIPVHLGVPAVSPRWTVDAVDFMKGAVRLEFVGERRIGTTTPPLATWEMSNGLVRVSPGNAGSFSVACWDAAAWRSVKSYQIAVSGAALTDQPEVTVLRNTPEDVGIRLTFPGSPGRTTVDLSLRRGSRFVTGVIKRHSAATLRIQRTEAEAATEVTGGLRATTADADGNRFVLGSASTVTTSLATAHIAKATTTEFDFFAGHEVDASPQVGDAFADLLAQYLGNTAERTTVIPR